MFRCYPVSRCGVVSCQSFAAVHDSSQPRMSHHSLHALTTPSAVLGPDWGHVIEVTRYTRISPPLDATEARDCSELLRHSLLVVYSWCLHSAWCPVCMSTWSTVSVLAITAARSARVTQSFCEMTVVATTASYHVSNAWSVLLCV